MTPMQKLLELKRLAQASPGSGFGYEFWELLQSVHAVPLHLTGQTSPALWGRAFEAAFGLHSEHTDAWFEGAIQSGIEHGRSAASGQLQGEHTAEVRDVLQQIAEGIAAGTVKFSYARTDTAGRSAAPYTLVKQALGRLK